MNTCYVMHFNLTKAKAAGYKPTLTDEVIYLRSERIHSEFWFSPRYGRVSFSFTMKDGCNGARFIRNEYSHPEYWDEDVVYYTDEEEDAAFCEACRLSDVSYHLARDWALRPEHYNEDASFGKVHYYAQTDKTLLYGLHHWKYDLYGLLTLARKKANKWPNSKILWVARKVLWTWTRFIRCKKDRAWCSEGVCMTIQAAKPNFNGQADTLTPDDLHKELNK